MHPSWSSKTENSHKEINQFSLGKNLSAMDRQNGDATMASSSSIALLQERFRQLQRVREKRQERELLKLFSGSERIMANNRPPAAHHPDSLLSLGLNSQHRHADARALETPTSLWFKRSASRSTSFRNSDNSDVDTSLHL